MKKNIIFVNSLFQMIAAIQIRRAMYPEEYFDVVLSDASYGLQEIYESGCLDHLFDNVFFANISNNYLLKKKRGIVSKCKRVKNRVILLFSPGHMLEHIIDHQIEYDYTDLFFWNPNVLFYSFFMECNIQKNNVQLHIYQDGIANYFLDAPDSDIQGGVRLFKMQLANHFISRRYGYNNIYNMDFDHYFFEPKWYMGEIRHELIEIPKIQKNEANYKVLNSVFYIDQIKEIKEKYIFFDQPYSNNEIDNTSYYELIRKIKDYVGSQNFIVKLHPRTKPDVFTSLGIKIESDRYPWELYGLKYSLSSKVLFTIMSASAIVSDAIFGEDQKCKRVLLFDMIELYGSDLFCETMDKAKCFFRERKVRSNIFIPQNWDELEDFLRA